MYKFHWVITFDKHMLLIWYFYTSSMLEILWWTEELRRHTVHQRPKFWVQILKNKQTNKQTKKCQNLEVFPNFNIHINFRQTNAINMIFFTEALCWKYYNKPKNLLVIQFIKYPNFGFKNWKKKHEKYQNLEVIFKF